MKTLKLLLLNIWGGRVTDPLLAFIHKHQDIDIFCFQEVFNTKYELVRPAIKDSVNNIFQLISDRLPDHQGFFCSEQDEEEGIAMFIRRSISVNKVDHIFVHRWKNAMHMEIGEDGRMLGRALQYAEIHWNNQPLLIAHFHGLWNGQGKTDSPDRLEQSQKTIEFLRKFPGSKILMTDLNVFPETESLKILEKDLKNLIKEYNITSTRSSLYQKPSKYADYVLVSPDIKVANFKVLPDIVSDHAPLLLEIE